MQRALLLKGSTTSTQKSLTAGAQQSLYLASLQKDTYCKVHGHTAISHVLLEVQFLMGVMIDLVVVGLYDVGCQWANVNVLPESAGRP